MNLSPLQLDTNCFNPISHYHSSFTSAWSSSPPLSSSLLCPSTSMNYQPSSVPSALQPIENYCLTESYYPSPSEPIASSSQFSSVPPPPHLYSSDDYPIPSSSSTMMLPQNRANYTRHQLVMLNEIFKKHTYPNSLQKTMIAKYIGVSRDQIRIWFQNKRRKVQLINKGQAKQTKSDVECEYGDYRRHLPKNFLDDLFQELYTARGAPARLPVKRDNNSKMHHYEQQPAQDFVYYPPMNSTYYYQTTHDDSSHGHHDEPYLSNYPHPMYSTHL